ncbi:hypothetical protein [Paucimonas lemoignei]|nr:hypothetical protein [Paucimonas lemoignei]
MKAIIRGDGVNSSVEFSVEEVIARHHGKPWRELDEADRETEFKEYARGLFSRQTGLNADVDITLEPGTSSKTSI